MSRKSKVAFLVVALIFFAVAAGCIWWLVGTKVEAQTQQQAFSALAKEVHTEVKDIPSSVLQILGTEQNTVSSGIPANSTPALEFHDVQQLIEANPDCVGWVNFVNTGVSYPVMYSTKDTEYYLHRNFSGEYSSYGTPFLNTADLNSSNLYLYGHSMQDGGMFAPLKQYKDPAYLEEHKLVVLETQEGIRYYEVVAAVQCRVERDTALFQYRESNRFSEYQAAVKKLTGDMAGNAIAENDKLLTVLTCDKAQYEDGRLLLVMKEIR